MKKVSSKRKLDTYSKNAEKALREAVREALIDHKRTGDPVYVWENGKVVKIPAHKIPFKIPKRK